jgi:mannosyltransferase
MNNQDRVRWYRWMLPILLLAFVLRIAYLDAQSLWWDEAFSFSMSVTDLPSLMQNTVHYRVHPPLYYAMMHFWLVLGHQEFLLRFFSVLSGMISISIMYVAASIVGGKRLGVLAALLLAVSPFNVWYSQEVRMYSLTTMLVLAASAAFLRLLRDNAIVNWVAYGLLSLLALYSDYIYLFIALGHGMLLVILRRRYPKLLRQWFYCTVVVGALFTPWLLAIFSTGGFYSASISWIPPAHTSDLFWTIYSLAVGVTTSPRNPLCLGAALLALSFIGYGLASLRTHPREERVRVEALVIWLVLPLLLTFLISVDWPIPHKRSIYIDRFFNPLLPAFLILVGIGIQRAVSTKRAISALVLAVLVICLGSSMRNLHYDHAYVRDEWREAVAHVNHSAQPGDLVLVRPHDYVPMYYYKIEGVEWIAVPYLSSPEEHHQFFSSEISPLLASGRRAWTIIVCENANPHRFVQTRSEDLKERVLGDQLRAWLLANYELLSSRTYVGIYLASYGT